MEHADEFFSHKKIKKDESLTEDEEWFLDDELPSKEKANYVLPVDEYEVVTGAS